LLSAYLNLKIKSKLLIDNKSLTFGVYQYHLIHFCHSTSVSPETIVNGRKSDAFSLAV
jgi:hypothetical protein